MNPQYTNDGLHLLGKGYLLWRDIVKPYVNKK
jgi:lysophospholipase L1-like esterase